MIIQPLAKTPNGIWSTNITRVLHIILILPTLAQKEAYQIFMLLFMGIFHSNNPFIPDYTTYLPSLGFVLPILLSACSFSLST